MNHAQPLPTTPSPADSRELCAKARIEMVPCFYWFVKDSSFRMAETGRSVGCSPRGGSQTGGSHLHPSWTVSHSVNIPIWSRSWFYQMPLEPAPPRPNWNPHRPSVSKARDTGQPGLPGPQNPTLLRSHSDDHKLLLLNDTEEKEEVFSPSLHSLSSQAPKETIINSLVWDIPDAI